MCVSTLWYSTTSRDSPQFQARIICVYFPGGGGVTIVKIAIMSIILFQIFKLMVYIDYTMFTVAFPI